MFSRIKIALAKIAGKPNELPESPIDDASARDDQVSVWAGEHGVSVSGQTVDGRFTLGGRVGAKPWSMERSRATRAFIAGDELRARAELDLSHDVVVVVMNRVLKEALEKQAYAIYTDSLQTTVDTSLPEEMRWLSMYEEVVWDALPAQFRAHFAVVAHDRSEAIAWLDQGLLEMLLNWPEPGLSGETPFMILIQRGKVFMRMECNRAELSTIEHATALLELACQSALARFPNASV